MSYTSNGHDQATAASDRDARDTVVVGLLADPGVATKVGERLADQLPQVLSRRINDRVTWHVRVVSGQLPLDEHGTILLVDIAREGDSQGGWDFAVCLTELARRLGCRPLAAEVSTVYDAGMAQRGIRVNCIAPGPVWTPLIPSTFPEEKVEHFGGNAPVGRPADPDEIAPSYVFFASNRLSSYYTGEVLAPVGGETLPGG